MAGREPDADPAVAELSWRCAECLPEALAAGRWCALGQAAPPGRDPRTAGVLASHTGTGSSPWAQLCGLLAAIPDSTVVSVARDLAEDDVWLVLAHTSTPPARPRRSELAVDGLPAAVEALTALVERGVRSSAAR